jgi:hypothetical protein
MTARQLVLTVVAIAASSACGGRALNPGPTSGAAGNGGAGHEGGTAGTAGTSGSVGAGGSVGTGGTGGSGIAAGGTGGAGGITSTGAAGTCGVERLTAAEATGLYRKYAFEVQPGPGLNPTVIFEGVPLDVPGLWEGLNAQLFLVKGFSQDGSPWRDCTIMTSACRVFIPSAECGLAVRPLSSGLVANGAFYFAWGSGSGVFRSRLGKLAPDGAEFTKSVSPEYFNANSSGPPLVLQTSGSDILVYRARDTAFNQWSSAELIGKLKDLGDSLTIVDDSGQPIAATLP